MPQPQTSNAPNNAVRREGDRDRSFGQGYRPTAVDRFGVWLSARQIRKYTDSLVGKQVGDFGCGYHAAFIRSALSSLQKAVIVDCALAEDLRTDPKVWAIEGILPDAVGQIPSVSLDVILCISVLEHLWEPLTLLRECLRIIRPGGICLFNVPSWRGKRFLEYSAFHLGLSPKDEMDDHKAYYDVRDFWPLLIRAGFRPSDIRCFPHKFGLNTFAACRVPRSLIQDV
jgi:SAM-dependent methyltransferase